MYTLSEQTLITLVLYNCNLENSDAYKSIIESNKDKKLHILIYNNSPAVKIETEFNTKHHIEIIHDNSNAGVSKAYNCGAKRAKEQKLTWILLVDQDTIFPKHFFEETEEYISQFPGEKLFAPILTSNNTYLSPCYFKYNRGKISSNITIGLNNFKNKSLLNSGLLIDVHTFLELGGYNEKIKLDFSDFYFISKFQKKYKTFILTKSKCEHNLSATELDLEKQLIRFKFYFEGALEYGKSVNQLLQIFILIIFRTLLLSIRHKTFRYFLILKNNGLHKIK
jgi:GT2 family glycosyltransferase